MVATLALAVAQFIVLPGEAGAVICWLDSPNNIVKCNGGSSNEAFIIGASGLNSTFTICYQNLNNNRLNQLFTFDRALFDHMEITGNAGNDTIQVILSGYYNCYVPPSSWTGINPYGSKWDEYLAAWGGGDVDTISGTNNDDYLNGDPGSDTIHGQDGDDTINGQGGDDYLYGDAGCDTITGGEDDDHIYLSTSENGSDTCASPNRNRAYGGLGIDTIHGGVNAMNDIWGNGNNDIT